MLLQVDAEEAMEISPGEQVIALFIMLKHAMQHEQEDLEIQEAMNPNPESDDRNDWREVYDSQPSNPFLSDTFKKHGSKNRAAVTSVVVRKSLSLLDEDCRLLVPLLFFNPIEVSS